MSETPRVGCPYLAGRTTDTFVEGFALSGRNLYFNNASVAGRVYVSRVATEGAAETNGYYTDVSAAGYTSVVTYGGSAGSPPHYEIATQGTGAYSGHVIIDSASLIQLEAANGMVTSDSLLRITDVTANQLQLRYDASNHYAVDVDADGSTTLTSTGTNADFEIASGTGGDITLDATGDVILEAAGGNVNVDAVITSSVGAGSPILEFAATSDSPTVAFNKLKLGNQATSGASFAMSTSPAGYLEVLVGAAARYIPFWA